MKKLLLMAAAMLMPLIAFAQEDRPEQFVIDGLRIVVNEGGDAHVTVALAEQPTADVTVKVRSSNYSRLYIVEGGALFFTPDNWAEPQTTSLKAIDDAICEGDALIDITIFSTSKDKAFNECKAVRQIRVAENDEAALSLTPDPLVINKQNKSGNLFVKLLRQPTEDVKVVVRCTDSNVSLSGNTLTFTSVNWSAVQKVGVTINDRVNGQTAISLMATAHSEAEAFNGITVQAALRIAGVEVVEETAVAAEDHSDDGDVEEEETAGKQKKEKASKPAKEEKQKTPEQLKKEKEKQKAAAKKAAEKKKKETAKKKEAAKKEAAKKKAAAAKKKAAAKKR